LRIYKYLQQFIKVGTNERLEVLNNTYSPKKETLPKERRDGDAISNDVNKKR